MPSCAHVQTSKNSSSVPAPPGMREKPVGEVRHQRLPLVHGGDDAEIVGGRCARPRGPAAPSGMTPVTSPPARRTASASSPISPTRAPPYTSRMPRRARAVPRCRAAAAYSGRTPGLDPQNTQRLRMGNKKAAGLPTASRPGGRRVADGSAGCGPEACSPVGEDAGDGGAGRNCTAVRKRLASESTCVSASVVSLPASRSGQNRRKPAKVKFRSCQPWRPTAAILLK